MRTGFKCRAYPTPEQQAALSRTFGCVRVVWNRTLAWRQARWQDEQARTSYADASAFLTQLKRDPEFAFLCEVSCVPLQQAVRTQHITEPQQPPATHSAVGVDLGISDFAVLSNAVRVPNPRHLARKARNLARYQRRMNRCQRGSANRAKAKAKVARAHRKVRHARADFLHKTSTRLVRAHDVIVIEDLAVANMIRNKRLARVIADAGWGELRRQLEYKTARYGRRLIVIDRWYPSSKICSACGHLLDLSTRHWTCPGCGTLHDRDLNAAKNILAAGLAVTACGADVRHSGPPRVRSAVKQEPQPVKVAIPRP